VDFVVVERRTPLLMVECKWADAEIDRSLRYLKARFPKSDAWQVPGGRHQGLRQPGRCPRGARARAARKSDLTSMS
jgi:hypothetical protein